MNKGLIVFGLFVLIGLSFSYCNGNYLSGNWTILNSTSCSNEVIYVTGNINITSNSSPYSTNEYFDDQSFNLSTYQGYIEVEQEPDGSGTNPAYTSDWDQGSNTFKIFMNQTQNAIQIYANITDAIYTVGFDTSECEDEAECDSEDDALTHLVIGNMSVYDEEDEQWINFSGVYGYNESDESLGYTKLESGTVYDTVWDSNLNHNCSVYYYQNSANTTYELVINCTDGWANKIVYDDFISEKYTVFTNGSAISGIGNLTLNNVSLIFNLTNNGTAGFSMENDYSTFHAENITMTSNNSNLFYNLSQITGGDAGRNHFYLNNSDISHAREMLTFYMLDYGANITNNVFHNFSSGGFVALAGYETSGTNNTIISGNTFYYNSSGQIYNTPIDINGGSSYNRIENNIFINASGAYFTTLFLQNGNNQYNNITGNTGLYAIITESENNIFRNNDFVYLTDNNDTEENTIIYNNSYGSINWTLSNLSFNISLGMDNITISQENITFDPTLYPNLNNSASLEFYNIVSPDAIPQLTRNGVRCDNTSLCNISFVGTTLYANISSFSSYDVVTFGPKTRVVNGSFGAYGNGSYYYDTIQEAVDAASDGDKILIFINSSSDAGYEENVTISKKLNITGYTSNVLITSIGIDGIALNVSEQCNISNLVITYDSDGGIGLNLSGNSNYTKVSNVVFHGIGYGIYAYDISYLTFNGLTLENTSTYGMLLEGGLYNIIENSTSRNSSVAGFGFAGFIMGSNITNCSSVNDAYGFMSQGAAYNNFNNISAINSSTAGFYSGLYTSENNLTNSYFNNCTIGIQAESTLTPYPDYSLYTSLIIKNNTIINSTTADIHLNNSNDTLIINNTLYNSAAKGILSVDSLNVSISGNNISNSGEFAISVGHMSNPVNLSNITVENNTLYNNAYGINFSVYTSSWDIENSRIKNNTIYNSNYGILIYQVAGINVTYNTIHNISNSSIYLSHSTASIVSYNNIFNGSTFSGGNALGAIYISSSGGTSSQAVSYNNISLSALGVYANSNNMRIHNNTISNISYFGVQLSSSDVQIKDNTFYNNNYSAIWAISASDTIITSNNISNSTKYLFYADIYIFRGAINLVNSNSTYLASNNIYDCLDGIYAINSNISLFGLNTINATNYSIYVTNATINYSHSNSINTLNATGYDLYLENATLISEFANFTTPYLTYALNTSNNISIKSTNMSYYNLTTITNLYDSNNDSISFSNSKLVKTTSENYGLNITNVSANGSTSIKLFYNTSDLGDYSTDYLGVGKTSLGENWTYYSQDTTPTTSIILNNITNFSYFAPLVYSVSSPTPTPTTSSSSSQPTKKTMNLEYRFNCETGLLEVSAVEDAQVLIIGSYQPSKIADENGYTNFTLFSGTYTIKATLEGYHNAYLTNIELTTCTSSEQQEEPETNQTEEPELKCGNYSLGDTWETYDGCNTCYCSCELVDNQPEEFCGCTEIYCPTEEEQALYSIEYAQNEINEANSKGKDTTNAQELLEQAKQAYDEQDYELSQQLSEQALTLAQDAQAPEQPEDNNQPTEEQQEQDLTLLYILGGIIVVVILGAGAFVLFKMKK